MSPPRSTMRTDFTPRSGTPTNWFTRFTHWQRSPLSPTSQIIMDVEPQVDVVPPAEIQIIEVEHFLPHDCVVPVRREDGQSCVCGNWQFYSAVCGHVYQSFDEKCGARRTKKNTRTIFCP